MSGSARSFDLEDQLSFAACSGDFNPLHIDPVQSRRSIYGEAVVHGVHLVCWSLNAFFEASGDQRSISRLRVSFDAPVFLGTEVDLQATPAENDGVKIVLRAHGKKAASINVDLEDWTANAKHTSYIAQDFAKEAPDDPEESDNSSGKLAVTPAPASFAALFPSLADRLSPNEAGDLLALTRLVGMHYPGLRSLFGGFDVGFESDGTGPSEAGDTHEVLAFETERFDKRFSMATVGFRTPRLSGKLRAFFRPRSPTSESQNKIRALVPAHAFLGKRFLVIGGTRGIGESIARLAVAGDAEVVLTYVHGETEARELVAELSAEGGHVEARQLDVTWPTHRIETALCDLGDLNLVAIMAAPKIRLTPAGSFDDELFSSYAAVFVSGPASVVAATRKAASPECLFFLPSTAFLDSEGDGKGSEYTAAKAAAETVWHSFARADRGLRFACPRLPPVRTDQTADFLSGSAEEQLPSPSELMAPFLLAQFGPTANQLSG